MSSIKVAHPVAAMLNNGSGRNEQSQQRTFHRCFLPSFGSFGETVSEEKNLKKSANYKKDIACGAATGNSCF
jgi:hypothetical protein